jgi:NAD(P) transhydrogenase subunit beta
MLFLAAGLLFILSLRGLASPISAQLGNRLGAVGMCVAVGTSLLFCSPAKLPYIFGAIAIGGAGGLAISRKIEMTALPQLVAAFHSLIGLAAVLVCAATLLSPHVFGLSAGGEGGLKFINLAEIGIGTVIGALTFTGSIVAFLKLCGVLRQSRAMPWEFLEVVGSIMLSFCYFVGSGSALPFYALTTFAAILGIMVVRQVGGADMPVVVSILNSFSGWAAAATGFTINNHLLIITGALVGASGTILSHIMCKNMNRSLGSVLWSGIGARRACGSDENCAASDASAVASKAAAKIGSQEEAAFILQNASSVIIVPGYGMAVARAQHVIYDIAEKLRGSGVRVRYAVHPVAGRMPGHMNVLLAEAKVPYEDVFDLEEINNDFASTDVAFVIGANDITNPAAHSDPSSSIYGMPIFDVEKAGIVLFVKRSLGTGYAGVENELFYRPNTVMILGDAKKVCDGVAASLRTR